MTDYSNALDRASPLDMRALQAITHREINARFRLMGEAVKWQATEPIHRGPVHRRRMRRQVMRRLGV